MIAESAASFVWFACQHSTSPTECRKRKFATGDVEQISVDGAALCCAHCRSRDCEAAGFAVRKRKGPIAVRPECQDAWRPRYTRATVVPTEPVAPIREELGQTFGDLNRSRGLK